VYNTDTTISALINCGIFPAYRIIYNEAVFYDTKKLESYAEGKNENFYLLLDIGERNRRVIRYLKINCAYGVELEPVGGGKCSRHIAKRGGYGIRRNISSSTVSN